jgi:tRNA threonylcarbamoyladenosine biosynthesis protein TsaB
MTIVLAIDCAAGACSAAICRAHEDAEHLQTLAATKLMMQRGHAEVLMPLLARLRAEAGIEWSEIGLITATVGPGSFTGVRIGLSAARGLALATGAPTVAVQSLEAIATGLTPGPSAETLLVALDSRRGDAYGQWRVDGAFRPADIIPTSRVDVPDGVRGGADIIVAGDLVDVLTSRLRYSGHRATAMHGTEAPDPADVAALGYRRHIAEGPSVLSPVYLRPADAKPALAKPSKTE